MADISTPPGHTIPSSHFRTPSDSIFSSSSSVVSSATTIPPPEQAHMLSTRRTTEAMESLIRSTHIHSALGPVDQEERKHKALLEGALIHPDTTRPSRKRATSIIVDDHHYQSRTADLNPYTSMSRHPSASDVGPGPKDLMCICPKATRVPRPRNAFILYRQHWQASVAAQNPGLANPDISKLIGEQWREQPDEVKDVWKELADQEKIRHQLQYPDYRYQPRRGGKSGSSGKHVSSGGDEHCPKCGGRVFITPQTPSTPTTPAAAKPQLGLSQSSNIMPNPRVIEIGHLRRSSHPDVVDSNRGPYIRSHSRDVDVSHRMPSPPAGYQPEIKRRRLNQFEGGFAQPPSPPLTGHLPQSLDTRLQQSSSIVEPAVAAHGFNAGPLPRPSPYPQHQAQLRQVPGGPLGMQPPPRPNISFPDSIEQAITTRGGPQGFDESLRLPPLQTQLSRSPPTNSEIRTPNGVTIFHHNTGLGIINQPIRQRKQNEEQQKVHGNSSNWEVLVKLEMLKAISPPLKPSSPDQTTFETRGPIIALEGSSIIALKEVGAVVQKALCISGQCAVKVWIGQDCVDATRDRDERPVPATPDQATTEAPEAGGGFASPLAGYMANMLRWHRTSEDLIKFITHHPPTQSTIIGKGSLGNVGTTGAVVGPPTPAMTSSREASPSGVPHQLPVAVMSTGYSLSVSEYYARYLSVSDAYHAEDHWRWVATLWRGIVGPDLTLYVQQCGDEELRGANCVEFINPVVILVRVPDGREPFVDDRFERRLGFEIMEWIRSGTFQGQPSGSGDEPP
ncbi:hypothetical protein BX600DRAFT_131073 [Xylariales sp. PMI_506]|nr:hypothetical protein BX600DRAFT_131073 [Xylariales sp. PMI_506]